MSETINLWDCYIVALLTGEIFKLLDIKHNAKITAIPNKSTNKLNTRKGKNIQILLTVTKSTLRKIVVVQDKNVRISGTALHYKTLYRSGLLIYPATIPSSTAHCNKQILFSSKP